MSIYIHKSHNVTVLLYHIVCPTKYRQIILGEEVDSKLKEICLEISKRYDIAFLEIGTDEDHVHFLVQSVSMYSVTKIVRTIKSITARELKKRSEEVKRELWGGEFWSDGYYASSVGKHGNEKVICEYVKGQGREKEYKTIHKDQLKLWN